MSENWFFIAMASFVMAALGYIPWWPFFVIAALSLLIEENPGVRP